MPKENAAEKRLRLEKEQVERKEKERIEQENFEKEIPGHMFKLMVNMTNIARAGHLAMEINIEESEQFGVVVNFEFHNRNYDNIQIATKGLKIWEIEDPIQELERHILREKQVLEDEETRRNALAKLSKKEKELLGLV